jgi:DNA-binding IclR family transcriptional regulator
MVMTNLHTLDKGIAILALLSSEGPTLSVARIAERMELPLSTAYRYVSALKAQRLVEQDPLSGTYRLGPRLLEWAAAISRPDVRELALPWMVKLSRRSGETVILSGLRGHQGICLAKVEGHHALRVSHELGAVFPLHAGTSGKTLMAYLEPDDQEGILRDVGLERFTETTITDPDALREELRGICHRGHSESDGEVLRGTYGIGAPVFGVGRVIVAALSVSAPRHRLEGDRRTQTIQWVSETANEVTRSLVANGLG